MDRPVIKARGRLKSPLRSLRPPSLHPERPFRSIHRVSAPGNLRV